MKILTINSGSSSLKIAFFQIDGSEQKRICTAKIERIGRNQGVFQVKEEAGNVLINEEGVFPDHVIALQTIFKWFFSRYTLEEIDAVGHRIVHGGIKFVYPVRIDGELMKALAELEHIVPEHLPNQIKVIDFIAKQYPHLKQAACFDTSFHRTMPKIAQEYSFPESLQAPEIIRYGFHGLSYEYILHRLRKIAPVEAEGRLIIAHLGNGASMAAVKKGKSMETTMGFTPAGGLVMSSRCGDIDPAVILYLMTEKSMTAKAINQLINKQSGILGVSGISSDMKDLLDKENASLNAKNAIDLFCYQVKKFIGALSTTMEGIDSLIFTGGIGENSPEVRQRICNGMEFLGIHCDHTRNMNQEAIISTNEGAVKVRVMQTDEEWMIALHTHRLFS